MWRRRARTGVLLVVALVSLYLLLPSLLAVLASWHSLTHLDWTFAALTLVSEAASFVALWELQRIALHTRAWLPVAAAQLTGNAVGRILPGGAATATAVSVGVLRQAGFETGEAVAAFTASTALQLATRLALPVLALPAIIGGAPISHSLATAAYLGLAVVGLLVAAGAAAFVSDAPLELAGRTLQWFLNATVRRNHPVKRLPEALLRARDSIARTLGPHWLSALVASAASAGFDYLALLAALRAVGADPQPSLVLFAYTSAQLLALVPFTPGGLGFVEAGLVGTLTLAGVSGEDALAATLLYRLVSYWLPLPAGAVAYGLFRRNVVAKSTQPVRGSPDAATGQDSGPSEEPTREVTMANAPLLICYDGSDDSVRGIDVAAALFGARRAVVLDVGPPLTTAESFAAISSVVPGNAFEELNTDDALSRAKAGTERARKAGLDAEPRATLSAPTWEGIVDVADEIGAAVIVIGSRGLSGAKEAFEGSVSHQVAEHAGRPVLIVPPAADGR